MVNLSFHLLRTVQPVKHLSPAEIEATSKILLGALGLDRAWEFGGYVPVSRLTKTNPNRRGHHRYYLQSLRLSRRVYAAR
jgi:hypothetical protein